MCPLRRRSAQLLLVAAVLPLAALAGCAADARHTVTASVSHGPATKPALTHALHAILAGEGAMSEAEAETVIARAIVQHEMHRP